MENKDKLSKLLTELQNREKAKRFQEIVSGVSAQVYKVIEPLTSKKLKEHANAVAKVVGELENNVFKATKLLAEGKKENAEVLATLQIKLAENQTELQKQVKVFGESFDKVQKRFEERGAKIEGSVTELAEKAQKANEAILKIIADIKKSIPKQIELEEGDNIKIDKSEKDGKVVYKITGERPVISISGGTGGGTSLPDQTGNSGKFLTTDGSNPSWGNPAGSGTVTNVSVVGTSTIGATVTNATSTPEITMRVLPLGIGLSELGEKSYNSLTDLPNLGNYVLGSSLYGLYVLGTSVGDYVVGNSVFGQYVVGGSFHSAVSVVGSSTVQLGISNNQSLIATVLQSGLRLSNFGEKSYNSLADKPDLSVYILGASVIGQYVLGTSIYTNEMAQDTVGLSLVQTSDSISWFYDDANNNLYADVSVDNTTIEVDTTNNYIKVKQSGLGLSAFGERAYASLTGTPTAPSGVGGTFISVGVSTNNAIGASLIRVQDDYRSRSFFIEAPTATDDFPIQYVMTGIIITNVVYAISGGTNWVGQLQVAYNAQGQSALDTQAADSTVASNVNGVSTSSFSVAGVTANAYLRLKTTSVAGGVSWLHVTYFYTAR